MSNMHEVLNILIIAVGDALEGWKDELLKKLSDDYDIMRH